MMTSLVILAVVSLVSAQNLTGEPPCAVPCLQSAIAGSGCQPTDQACQCGSIGQFAIQQAVTPCLLLNCNGTEVQIAASIGLGLCSSYSASVSSVNATMTTHSSTSGVPGPATTGFSNTTAVTTGTVTKTTGSPTGASSTGSAGSVTSTAGAAATLVAGIGGVMALVGGAVALL